MRNSFSLLMLVIPVALAACKIEITVPKDGVVETSSGAYSCDAGEVCVIDVVDLFFDETFRARPSAGYVFKEWRKRDGSFCGGSEKPCRLFTTSFAGYDALLSILESDQFFFLEPVFVRNKAPYEYQLNSDLAYVETIGSQSGRRAVDIYFPESVGARPVVLMLHGGSGNKNQDNYVAVSRQLAEAGVVVFNVDHKLRTSPSVAIANVGEIARAGLEDALCALRYIAENASRYGGDPERITVLGHSAGGLNGSLAALGGTVLNSDLEKFNDDNGLPTQARCLAEADIPSVAGLVSYNGALFIFSHRNSPFAPPAGTLADLLDPRIYMGSASEKLKLRMILGGQDTATPQWHKDEIRWFAEDMHARGHNSSAVLIKDGVHDLTPSGPVWDRTQAAILAVTGK